uniref:THUMP domain-containing protein n=1 Tax=Heterorhabditis bacteriophora TaxID=37862 RepID=A0A1I7XA82_HETBA
MEETVPPALCSEENSCDQDDIQKLKAENRLSVGDDVNDEDNDLMETEVDEGDKENGDTTIAEDISSDDSPALRNGSGDSNGQLTCQSNGNDDNNEVECIELDDDGPPAKKAKTEDDDSKTLPTNSISKAIDNNKNVDRKVLDALLGAINVQVQKEPLSVRKLILDKQLVLPNTISFPPSLVVDMLIEHDPEHPLSKVINKMFGEERPKLSETEKKERQTLKVNNPAPHMTKLLMDIGQDLVQETTYCDIVHARNLPETPKNIETYKQVIFYLFAFNNVLLVIYYYRYVVSGVNHELCYNRIVLLLIIRVGSISVQCALNTTRMNNGCSTITCKCYSVLLKIRMIYLAISFFSESHLVIATKEETQAKYPCLICEEDFQFKGLRDQHMKICKKDYTKVRNVMGPKSADDVLMINRWLWERPPIDPTILQQQQAAQAQQKKNQLAQAQQAAAQAQALRRSAVGSNSQSAMVQQQLLQQQRLRQQMGMNAALINQQGRNMLGQNNNSLIAAMQQHLQRTASAQRGPSALGAQAQSLAAAAIYQKNLANANRNNLMANAAALRKNPVLANAAMQKALSSAAAMAVSNGNVTASAPSTGQNTNSCEICDQNVADKDRYLNHLQVKLNLSSWFLFIIFIIAIYRFWTYEGLERHLQYAFNMLQHLVADHQVKLCSAEIMLVCVLFFKSFIHYFIHSEVHFRYSCDVCSFKCSSYQTLESHLSTVHPKGGDKEKIENGPIKMVEIYATVITGFETITYEEVRERFRTEIKRGRGFVRFTIDVDKTAEVFKLRSPDNVFAIAYDDCVDRLRVLEKKHNFSSMDAARSLGAQVNNIFGWKPDMKNYDIEIVLNIRDNRVTVMIALNRMSLFKRNVCAYGPTTMRSTMCFCMISLAKPQPGEIIVDAMCGGGSISIEGTLSYPGCFFIAGDTHPKAIERCRENKVHYNI